MTNLGGKGLTLSVAKNCTADILLKTATDKHKAHSKNVMKQEASYILLYPDGTEVKTLKESSEKFVLYKYKECGRPYHRLSFFLCPTLGFSVCTLEQFLQDAEEISSGDEDLLKRVPERTETRTPSQDSDDERPVILDITSQKQEKAESSEDNSLYKLETLKEMFPRIDEAVLHDAITEAKYDINLAVSCIL